MTQRQSLVLGFDPGREKCGLALVDPLQGLLYRQVVITDQVVATVMHLHETWGFTRVVLGNQTMSKLWKQKLQEALPACSIMLVDERNSSLEARQRYWDFHPPRGWQRCLPKGLRVPPQPYDDIVALILVERFWQREATHV